MSEQEMTPRKRLVLADLARRLVKLVDNNLAENRITFQWLIQPSALRPAWIRLRMGIAPPENLDSMSLEDLALLWAGAVIHDLAKNQKTPVNALYSLIREQVNRRDPAWYGTVNWAQNDREEELVEEHLRTDPDTAVADADPEVTLPVSVVFIRKQVSVVRRRVRFETDAMVLDREEVLGRIRNGDEIGLARLIKDNVMEKATDWPVAGFPPGTDPREAELALPADRPAASVMETEQLIGGPDWRALARELTEALLRNPHANLAAPPPAPAPAPVPVPVPVPGQPFGIAAMLGMGRPV